MSQERFLNHTLGEQLEMQAEFRKRMKTITERKGPEYSPTGVAFKEVEKEALRWMASNPALKREGHLFNAMMWGLHNHLSKHLAGIESYITVGGRREAEKVEDRLVDAANYLSLMFCLVMWRKYLMADLPAGAEAKWRCGPSRIFFEGCECFEQIPELGHVPDKCEKHGNRPIEVRNFLEWGDEGSEVWVPKYQH